MANHPLDQIIATLRANELELCRRGVIHAALFGSRARGEETSRSDTDILIEIDPDAHIGLWGYAGVKAYFAGLFDGPVDVIDRDSLKPHLRGGATSDAIYAF